MIFSGICLLTKDVQRLSDFYQKILQTTSDCDDEIHTQGAFLAILKYYDANGGNPNMNMAFTVDDVDTEYFRLKELGVEIIDEPTTRPWGLKICAFVILTGIISYSEVSRKDKKLNSGLLIRLIKLIYCLSPKFEVGVLYIMQCPYLFSVLYSLTAFCSF